MKQKEFKRLLYVRFGELPELERSRNHHTGELEKGVSVYRAIQYTDDTVEIIIPIVSYSACVSLSAFPEKKAYEVEGKLVGEGSDGEPLLIFVTIAREVEIARK